MALLVRVVLACAMVASASPGVAQPRDPTATDAARIRGRVVAFATGSPLAGVRISLEATRLLGTPPGAATRTTTTDAAGTFDFQDLRFGDYQLTASKTGYLLRTSRRDSVGGGYQVALRERQPPDPVTIQMIRAGAIEGRIVDVYGEPVARVRVAAERYRYGPDGERDASPSGIGDLTDDLGQFRIHGLPAGDFRVVATGLGAAVPQVWPSPPDRSAMPPTYYPGSVDPTEAQTVSLAPGDEVGVQFALVRGRLVRINGTVIRPDGTPAAGLPLRLRSSSGHSTMVRSAGTAGPDGTFEIGGVAPGEYWLDADTTRPGTLAETTSMPLVVSTEDLSGLTVVMTEGAVIRGTVAVAGNGPGDAPLRLAAVPIGGAGQAMAALRQSDQGGAVLDGGGFEIRGVIGRVLLQSGHDGWLVTSVVADGEERVDEPFDAARLAAIDDVRVTVTSRQGVVAGRVVDGRGRPRGEYAVVVLRTEQTGLAGQRVRVARTNAEGRFSIGQLRPGTYAAGAVEDLEDNYHFSPAFQERLRSLGHGFVLREGGAVTLDLIPTAGLR